MSTIADDTIPASLDPFDIGNADSAALHQTATYPARPPVQMSVPNLHFFCSGCLAIKDQTGNTTGGDPAISAAHQHSWAQLILPTAPAPPTGPPPHDTRWTTEQIKRLSDSFKADVGCPQSKVIDRGDIHLLLELLEHLTALGAEHHGDHGPCVLQFQQYIARKITSHVAGTSDAAAARSTLRSEVKRLVPLPDPPAQRPTPARQDGAPQRGRRDKPRKTSGRGGGGGDAHRDGSARREGGRGGGRG